MWRWDSRVMQGVFCLLKGKMYPGEGRCWALLQRAVQWRKPTIQPTKQEPLTLGVGRSSTPCPIACEKIVCQDSTLPQENEGCDNTQSVNLQCNLAHLHPPRIAPTPKCTQTITLYLAELSIKAKKGKGTKFGGHKTQH